MRTSILKNLICDFKTLFVTSKLYCLLQNLFVLQYFRPLSGDIKVMKRRNPANIRVCWIFHETKIQIKF
ncbi:hypothetical protein EJQ19_06325 [Paenibacillus whitsoniae]|uniref:Uncharacterized protein n=1 Tax=Paenibacillus whitsoniae TaxID=2496558 RepID=A0A430JIP1_9BACL|nr:hypothetical protein EJQ19_06325 [Paenibacillus whitsoniae]